MVTLLALVLAASSPLSTARQHLEAGQLDELVFDLPDSVSFSSSELPEATHLLSQGAAQAQQKGDSVLALQLAQMAHRRDQKGLEALRILTELALRDQSFTEADGYADTLGNLAPGDAHLGLLRARVANAEEDWPQAETLSAGLLSNKALSKAEQKEAKAIHTQAASFVAKSRAAGPNPREAELHAAAERAAQERTEAFSARSHTSGRTIVVYGTTWCGFCKQARSYFQQKHLDFEDKDVEKDPEAATEMRAKAKAAGFRPGGVPVLDVYGTILQGFSRPAVEKALKGG